MRFIWGSWFHSKHLNCKFFFQISSMLATLCSLLFHPFFPTVIFVDFHIVLACFSLLWFKKKVAKMKVFWVKVSYWHFWHQNFISKIIICLYNDLIFSEEPAIPISFPNTHQHPEHSCELALHFRYEIGPVKFCFEHEKAISKPICCNTEVSEV